MRVVHYLNRVRIADGGIARAVLDLCTLLAGAGHDVSLITFGPDDVPAAWNEPAPGVPRVVLISAPTMPARLYRSQAVRQLGELLRGADVLHLHGAWEPSNLQLAGAARAQGIPYVISLHGMLDRWSMKQRRLKKHLFLALGGRRLLRNAAAIHCTAQAELEQAAWARPKRAFVAPYVVDLDPFHVLPGPELAERTFGLPERGRRVLFLSRLHYKKRVEVLIEAAAILRDRNQGVTLLIAGTGDAPYTSGLESLVQERSLGDRVRFLGLVKGWEKVSLYQAADVFALPTSQENFGLVLTEALSCATPVITTPGVDIWPELKKSGAAAIVEPNPVAFADAITRMLEDAPALKKMGEEGRRYVLEWLDPMATLEKFVQCYARTGKKDGSLHAGAA
jgi:glycosyltransferase involved in cell wall biosynthesis